MLCGPDRERAFRGTWLGQCRALRPFGAYCYSVPRDVARVLLTEVTCVRSLSSHESVT